ncbi:MAG TPA: flagellar hook-basal body complex protein FliE [Chthonomonadaceae bacterium]|nr:flagellar hook-basal body complex protein FliE [Chthonomonadaceae bacterium]
MPIEALSGVAGPLASAIAPRTDPLVPGANIDGLKGPGEMPGAESAAPAGPTFGQMLQNAIGDVNQAQVRAADLSARFAAGENVDVHQVMIAAQEASVALNLAIQVRNKLVDGYQELMRVNV